MSLADAHKSPQPATAAAGLASRRAPFGKLHAGDTLYHFNPMHPVLMMLTAWLLLGPVAVTTWILAAALRMLAASLYGQLTAYSVRHHQCAALAPKTQAVRSHTALPTSQHAGQLSSAA